MKTSLQLQKFGPSNELNNLFLYVIGIFRSKIENQFYCLLVPVSKTMVIRLFNLEQYLLPLKAGSERKSAENSTLKYEETFLSECDFFACR